MTSIRSIRKRGHIVALSLLVGVLGGCGPSCAERGGESEFTHFTPVFTGKSVVLIPQYRCNLEQP